MADDGDCFMDTTTGTVLHKENAKIKPLMVGISYFFLAGPVVDVSHQPDCYFYHLLVHFH